MAHAHACGYQTIPPLSIYCVRSMRAGTAFVLACCPRLSSVDPCYDGQLFPGELKLNPISASIDAIAMVGDVDGDGALDLVLGTGAGESGSIFVALLERLWCRDHRQGGAN